MKRIDELQSGPVQIHLSMFSIVQGDRCCRLSMALASESLRQPLPRLAIGSRLRAARPETLRNAMRDQPSHRGTTGVVGAEHLSQEHPECHEWCENSVVPACANRRECLRGTSAVSTSVNGKFPS
jgi:hypothetical protein